MTPRRRRIAALAGAICAISASTLNLLHSSHASESRIYTVAGIFTGLLVGSALLVIQRRRADPCDSAPQA
jgi:peptidoglycan/LPS O-acetylase OafA/YrhL